MCKKTVYIPLFIFVIAFITGCSYKISGAVDMTYIKVPDEIYLTGNDIRRK